MKSEFPRVLTLLRKEKGISQKHAASELGISQALLSHYEKGVRECGLDFLVRCASFYDVSCDYLLGRSPDRKGTQIAVEDIPEPDSAGKENRSAAIMPILNKKLIANSLNVLYDLLAKSGSKALVTEISSFLMIAVYRMFRIVYGANPKNQEALFNVPSQVCRQYAGASMEVCEANAAAISAGKPVLGMDEVKDTDALGVSTETLNEAYPLFASSLLNLVQNAESRIGFQPKDKKS